MRFRNLLLASALLIGAQGFAQNFDGFNYQAVIRNGAGDPLPNQPVGVRFIIVSGILQPHIETYSVTTDAQGMIKLSMGQGTLQGGPAFSAIDWSNNSAWTYCVDVDITGGTNYQSLGCEGFKAVPFAMRALKSDAGPPSGWSLLGPTLSNTNAGNVGIGNPSPTAKLDVAGTFKLVDGSQGVNKVLTSDVNGLATWTTPPAGVGWSLNGNNLFNTNTGNVGIGTSTPDNRLQIRTTTNGAGIHLTAPADDVNQRTGILFSIPTSSSSQAKIEFESISGDKSALKFFTQTSTANMPERMRIDGEGNVGIGTTTPSGNRLRVVKVLGSNDAIAVQHDAQMEVRGVGNKALAVGVLDNGTSFLQSKEVNVGYNNLVLNPASGNVGIGTAGPAARLEVRASTSSSSSPAFKTEMVGANLMVYKGTNGVTVVENTSGSNLALQASGGNVGIGTSTPQSKLAVNGKITCKEVEVTLAGFPDYVFEKDYRIMPLSEVEAYIIANGHLPHVPSACEVEEHGLGLGEMNKILLEKVEELTLHAIAKEKDVQALRREMAERIARLEAMMISGSK